MIILKDKQYHAPTKQNRNEFYRRAWETFRTDPVGPYLCNVLAKMAREKYKIPAEDVTNKEIVTLFFPEVAIQMPTLLGAWGEDEESNNHRADVLATAIAETNAM